jgi:protein involved in polysaccharide export with SLBB domain
MMIKLNYLRFFGVIVLAPNLYSQNNINTQLSEEFLEGLPPSVREQIEVQNSVEEEDKLDDLFNSDTSLEKNKVILQKLKAQLSAIEKSLLNEDSDSRDSLERFGDKFFRTIQSSFMPINVPNVSSDYIIDVGDKFQLLLTGKIADSFELSVQRDGSIMIPEIGKIVLAGRSLIEAEDLVQAFLSSKTIGVDSYLTLMEIRDVQILMLGGVETVGIFTLPGGSNILSALNASGGIASNGSFRFIEHKRGEKLMGVYDLYDVFVSGEYVFKDTLRTGDVIFVRPKSFEIPITGGVINPGIFEIKNGETVEDIIKYAGGLSEGFAGHNYIQIERVSLESNIISRINVDDIEGFALQARDSVWVPSFQAAISKINRVTLSGHVNRPGTYFLEDGETYKDLLNKAGGYKQGAYVFGGALFRKDAVDTQKIFGQKNYSETINYLIANIGKSGMNLSEEILDFLAEELRSSTYNGRIIADFSLNSLKSSQNDFELHDGDSIVIPPFQKVVHLFGEFNLPSTTTYVNTNTIQDYIKSAGGLSQTAEKTILVIDPDGNAKSYSQGILNLFKSDIEIYPGTVIYAPRDIGQLQGVQYAATIAPILSSLALTVASLNSISD